MCLKTTVIKLQKHARKNAWMRTRMYTGLILAGVGVVKSTQVRDETPACSLLRTVLLSKIGSNGLNKEIWSTKVFLN